jgi:hypothetical protein
MSPSPPFVDIETRTFDFEQIWTEAYPLLGLILLFAVVAFVPLILGLASSTVFGLLFVVIGQLILAVGTGIVLMYVVARAIQLSGV